MAANDYGVFTPYTIMFHRDATGEPWDAFLKRAAILFDRILFMPEGLGPFADRDSVRGPDWYLAELYSGPEEFRRRFLDLFVYPADVIVDEDQFYQALSDDEANDLWHGEKGDVFRQWVRERVAREVRDGVIQNAAGAQVERQKYYLGNLSHDYKLLVALSRRSTDFSGLFSPLHQEAALRTFSVNATSAEATTRALGSVCFCDFGALAWPQVLALRDNAFVVDFRMKVRQWTETTFSASVDFERDLARLVLDGLFELSRKTQPDVPQALLSAVIGALPGVGAIASAKTLMDIADARRIERDYGWIYFVQSARLR
jgi:hypothetical protein